MSFKDVEHKGDALLRPHACEVLVHALQAAPPIDPISWVRHRSGRIPNELQRGPPLRRLTEEVDRRAHGDTRKPCLNRRFTAEPREGSDRGYQRILQNVFHVGPWTENPTNEALERTGMRSEDGLEGPLVAAAAARDELPVVRRANPLGELSRHLDHQEYSRSHAPTG